MYSRFLTTFFTIGLYFIAVASATAGTTTQDTIESDEVLYLDGVTAYRAQRFEEALALFKAAQEAGDGSAQVQYNIAVSYFRLGQLDDARKAFEELIGDPQLSWWSQYNMALIDEQQDLRHLAKRGFLQVANNAQDRELAKLAIQKNSALTGNSINTQPERELNKAPSRWLGSAGMGLGYDDNVIDPQDTAGSEQSDQYVESTLSLSNSWRSSGPLTWHLDALGYASRYSEVDEYDVNLVNLTVSSSFRVADWKLKTGISGDYSSVGDDGFLQTMAFNFSGRYSLHTGNVLKLAYRFSDYDSLSNQYDQLAGNGHRGDVQYTWYASDVFFWQLRYRLAIEERVDLEELDRFSSYSPVRHGLRLRGVWRPGDWEYAVALGIRDSQFQEDNRFSDGRLEQRQDIRLRAAVTALYQWTENWSANLELNYSDNQSSIDDFDYQRSSIVGGISWSF